MLKDKLLREQEISMLKTSDIQHTKDTKCYKDFENMKNSQ